jgi:hypothetical protein
MKKNYKLIALFAACFMALNVAVAQTPGTGKPIVEIYADFHKTLDKTSGTTGFDINRAFLGYAYTLDNNFLARVVINGAGNPNEAGAGGARRRYAHLREAAVAWQNENLTLTFGLTETRLFQSQQRWWGKRYLAADVQSMHGYGFVSDLGVVVDYKFNDILSGDITVMNGEGMHELQLDDNVRSSLGFTITPNRNFIFRVYGDHHRINGLHQYTGVAFAGYRNDYFYIGIDGTYKVNVHGFEYNSWAISTLNGIYLSEKNELFFRYDYAKSTSEQWADLADGIFTIIGLQHTFTPNLRMTLNYQGTKPYHSDVRDKRNLIYVNAHFRF